jgi:hypothetical protein
VPTLFLKSGGEVVGKDNHPVLRRNFGVHPSSIEEGI